MAEMCSAGSLLAAGTSTTASPVWPTSCKVATKAGYLLEGTKRSAAVHDDGRHDMHLHARIRED
jgi:hypothetical protein